MYVMGSENDAFSFYMLCNALRNIARRGGLMYDDKMQNNFWW